MKFDKIKKFFQIVAFVTPLTLTACSFKTTNISPIDHTEPADTQQTISIDIEQEQQQVSDIIDGISDELMKEYPSDVAEYLQEEIQNTDTLSKYEQVSIVRVVDGDTIVIDLFCPDKACDNQDHYYKVRLIGIDTPESVASESYLEKTGKENTVEGKNASKFTEEILSKYVHVYLEKDTSDTDKYGRLLRYVWLTVPDEEEMDADYISVNMLNGVLLKENVAEIATYKPDTKYEQEFKEIVNER